MDVGNSGTVVTIAATAVAALLVITGIVYLTAHRGRRRCTARELAGWAAGHGWSYEDSDWRLPVLAGSEPRGAAVAGQARHVLRGEHRGRGVVAYEYAYLPADKDLFGTYEMIDLRAGAAHVIGIDLPAAVPYLELRPKPPLYRLVRGKHAYGARVGLAGFDRRFRVRTGDPVFARTVLRRDFVAWLLSGPAHRDLPLRLEDSMMFTWRPEPLNPESLRDGADLLADALERIPGEVWG